MKQICTILFLLISVVVFSQTGFKIPLSELESASDSGYHIRANALGNAEWYEVTQYNGDTVIIWHPTLKKFAFIHKDSLLPSNNVTGSGTTNYLTKFTSSSTIGNANLTDNGTILDALLPIRLKSYTTAGLPTGAQGYTLYNTTFNQPQYHDGTSYRPFGEWFRNGTAGIYTIHDVEIRGQSGNANFAIKSNSGNGYWSFSAINATGNFTMFDANSSTTPLEIQKAAPNNSLYINSSGNIGLGTSSITSGYRLDARGNARFAPTSGGAVVEIVLPSGTSSAGTGFVTYEGSTTITSLETYGNSFSVANYRRATILRNYAGGDFLNVHFSGGTNRIRFRQKPDGKTIFSTKDYAVSAFPSPNYAFEIDATGALAVPYGTVAQRPTIIASTAPIRFNSDSTKYEGGYGAGDWRFFATENWVTSNFSSYTGFTPAADSGTGSNVASGGTLTQTGGYGINTSVTGTTVTLQADTSELATQYDVEQVWLKPKLESGNVSITSGNTLEFNNGGSDYLQLNRNYVSLYSTTGGFDLGNDYFQFSNSSSSKDGSAGITGTPTQTGIFAYTDETSIRKGIVLTNYTRTHFPSGFPNGLNRALFLTHDSTLTMDNWNGVFEFNTLVNPSLSDFSSRLVFSRGQRTTTDAHAQNNTVLGRINFSGWHVTSNLLTKFSSEIRSVSTENHSNTAFGGKLIFATTPNGDTTTQDRLTIDQNGSIVANNYGASNKTAADLSITRSGYNAAFGASGTIYETGGVLFTQTANGAVTNDTTETTVTASGVGTLTIPANYLEAGRTIVIKGTGYITNNSSVTLRMRAKLGGTTIGDTQAQTLENLGMANENFHFEYTFTCRSTGASGTIIGQGLFRYCPATGGLVPCQEFDMVNTSTTTINTTTTNTIDVTAQWGAASADNNIVMTNLIVEAKN